MLKVSKTLEQLSKEAHLCEAQPRTGYKIIRSNGDTALSGDTEIEKINNKLDLHVFIYSDRYLTFQFKMKLNVIKSLGSQAKHQQLLVSYFVSQN